MPDDLLYRPEDHTYWVTGKQWPGITSVLSALGYNGQGARFYTDNSRQLGTGVHLACPVADRGAPDCFELPEVLDRAFTNLHPDLHGYLGGWLLFKQEKNYRPVAWETPLASRKLRIACTFDNWGFGTGGKHIVVDMKSWKRSGTKPSRASEIQTAMQELVLKENGLIPKDALVQRYVVKLRGNYEYYAHLCDNPLDVAILHEIAHVWWDLYNHKLVTLSGDPDNEVAAIE